MVNWELQLADNMVKH